MVNRSTKKKSDTIYYLPFTIYYLPESRIKRRKQLLLESIKAMPNSREIRESFLSFFEQKDHLRMKSFPLIPQNDPTLLLIGAGMAPFKAYFERTEIPPHPRVTTCQKCVRADDIERVGKTARHHTFFEMLGSFSFGDYFKAESCSWALEYLTRVVKLAPERLYISVNSEDEEARKIWRDQVGIPPERIFSDPANFWGPIGKTGVCGPCSELIYDRGEKYKCESPDCGPGCDCDRFIEVWNLVFTGLYKEENQNFTPLPKPCIDTGLGFERLVMLLQEKDSPFETDLFAPLMEAIAALALKTDQQAFRIIADHIRALVFMAGDGVFPANDGRGYVFRRILRRASRFGLKVGIEKEFLTHLVPVVIEIMGDIYPEIKEKAAYTQKIISEEEKSFQRTLEQGILLLEERLERIKHQPEKLLSGPELFQLYDTYGFPVELSLEILAEKGFLGDLDGFGREMEKQRMRSGKTIAKEEALSHQQVEFAGYRILNTQAQVKEIWQKGKLIPSLKSGEIAQLVLTPTPFYAESGGQVGDQGEISAPGISGKVLDTAFLPGKTQYSLVKIARGELKSGDQVQAGVDQLRREKIAAHHTATHLLHWALRETLGKHVSQSGSLVSPDRLRFDFTHIGELSEEEIKKIEALVNQKIREDQPVLIKELPLKEALQQGAMALFEEKYGELVRMLQIGDFSRELCGGTHLSSTGKAGIFKIVKEEAIARGIRRIEALCGEAALEYLENLESILFSLTHQLKVPLFDLPKAVIKLKEDLKQAEQNSLKWEQKLALTIAESMLANARAFEHGRLVAEKVNELSQENLRALGDHLKEQLKSGAILLAQEKAASVSLLLILTPDLVDKGFDAGKILSELVVLVGGKGGGRADFAQAGGKDGSKLNLVFDKFYQSFER